MSTCKVTIILDDCVTGKYPSVVKYFQANETAALVAVTVPLMTHFLRGIFLLYLKKRRGEVILTQERSITHLRKLEANI